MKTYSQSGEDVIIQFIFNNIGIKTPTYIDIGAYHPTKLSNTALFYEQGSTGINVEPNPDLFTLFLEQRKNDINLNIGITASSGIKPFYKMNADTMCVFKQEDMNEYIQKHGFYLKGTIEVETDTITNVINKYSNGVYPDLLSIDAEGCELEILKSIDYTMQLPAVICVETLPYSHTLKWLPKDKNILEFLIQKNYKPYADTYINTIFVLGRYL